MTMSAMSTTSVEDSDKAADHEEATDRSLYWTISFYLAPENLPVLVGDAIKAGLKDGAPDEARIRTIQYAHDASRKLSQAIEPLFNDISDRERLGKVDDYLFAVGDKLKFTRLQISTPEVIAWETEGVEFRCAPPGAGGAREARVRRFWYVHKNGAVSWHLTFRVDYEHTPADFFFISMLQKVLAPKEFRPPKDVTLSDSLWVHAPPMEGTRIFPLDNVKVSEAGEVTAPFWSVIARWFNADAPVFFARLLRSKSTKKSQAGDPEDLFRLFMPRESFLEIPGLMMPRFRFMFFFKDKEFFRRLLPPIDPETNKPTPRAVMIQETCYKPYIDAINRAESADGEFVDMGADYWKWVLERPDYAEFRDKDPEAFKKSKAEILAWEEDTRPDCLVYLFLSGFNQNIIDFMNQDAHEVQDSLDPIYPKTEDQATERFFVRFANARALTTYVRTLRSLEAGNDYIGTCPYAFLVHVLALHNEFLARNHERTTLDMIDRVKALSKKNRLSEAAEEFYMFRTGPFADYFNHRYDNVFRYDTEADVFSEVEQRRGTERKTKYLEGIVSNIEKQTGDLQARIQKKEDRDFTLAVSFVGLFGLFQLLLQIEQMWEDDKRFNTTEWELPAVIVAGVGAVIVLIFFGYIVLKTVREAGYKNKAGKDRT